MPVRVKICGITNLEDAHAALNAGADALGFIFFKGSPRFIEPSDAASLIQRIVAPNVLKVGVFVNEPPADIQQIQTMTGIDAIQLHGEESPEICEQVTCGQVIKAFRVKDQATLAELPRYRVSAFLLDSYVPGQLGGTGAKFNWDLAVQAKALGTPVILAGGLTVENVADAVAKVGPYAVDVSSGVESSPGRKEHAKVREFIQRAKGT